ncbi:membrane protein [Salmonella enterica subsp. enterica serovar Choleraesuis]|nr:membrane protein [Salmonella enterica subsp. enterica serovar Choleraesuis]
MNTTIWLALALVLVFEGLGPMLYPNLWRRMVVALTQLPETMLRRFGGGLVVAGIVIYYMLRKTIN